MFILKIQFFYYIDVYKNGKSRINVTTSVFMTLVVHCISFYTTNIDIYMYKMFIVHYIKYNLWSKVKITPMYNGLKEMSSWNAPNDDE